jgi:hypothetical protein
VGIFSSTKTIPISTPDLAPIANDLVLHFQRQGYKTTSSPRLSGGWDVSIAKGGIFKSVIGIKTALNIEIVTGRSETNVRAGVGIFGQRAIPAAISFLLAPLALPLFLLFWLLQILGLVRQSHLDEEAIACVEDSLKNHVRQSTSSGQHGFCVECGAAVTTGTNVCGKCGAKLPQSQSVGSGS